MPHTFTPASLSGKPGRKAGHTSRPDAMLPETISLAVSACDMAAILLDDLSSMCLGETSVMWEPTPLFDSKDYPGLTQVWSLADIVRPRGARAPRLLTYGLDPACFRSGGRALNLPWKEGGRVSRRRV